MDNYNKIWALIGKTDLLNYEEKNELHLYLMGLKKQKEIIDKMKTTIKNDMDGFTTINEHGESQEILDLLEIYLEILEDKEV